MALKNLPLGISTLSKLLENNCIYVDKTEYAHKLVTQSGAFFLSRPRRFGKSLFVDTLKEIFEGNQKLFEGLYIYDKWDWSKKYPVIKLDFVTGGGGNLAEFDIRISEMLRMNGKRLGVTLNSTDYVGKFGELISEAAAKYGQRVVVLVDEYEKPLLDNIDNPQIARELVSVLNNLYSVLKEQAANLQFVFMTGVTNYSKAIMFSGLNHFEDITINKTYSSIFGYTDKELQHHLSEYLADKDLEVLKQWYNGYNWTGPDTVYNPNDILLFLDSHVFRNYWFETGTPSFLIKLFKKHQYLLPDLDNIEVSEQILSSFDMDSHNPITLLFQTGYLTIEKTFIQDGRLAFRLKIPNKEVQLSLGIYFIKDDKDDARK
jgi:hypothetical protein